MWFEIIFTCSCIHVIIVVCVKIYKGRRNTRHVMLIVARHQESWKFERTPQFLCDKLTTDDWERNRSLIFEFESEVHRDQNPHSWALEVDGERSQARSLILSTLNLRSAKVDCIKLKNRKVVWKTVRLHDKKIDTWFGEPLSNLIEEYTTPISSVVQETPTNKTSRETQQKRQKDTANSSCTFEIKRLL